jgi:hypothetical protein
MIKPSFLLLLGAAMLVSPGFARRQYLPSCDLVFVLPSCDFFLGYHLCAISLLSLTFMRFMIKNLRLLVGVKNITLTFSCWDDRASFDELTVI